MRSADRPGAWWHLLLCGLLALQSASVLAAQSPVPPAPEPPARTGEPGSDLTVYLMTMGPGRLVYERFGHNAIWIHDPTAGTDQAYNYGLFDFQQENFLVRFIQGQMWYWMQGFPAERYLSSYLRDNRSVWIQELALSPSARLELQKFLRWNEQPENRFYHYDYYRDNCSTRVRDALDRVLGGRIEARTDSVATGTTYRFHTQRLTANDPLVFTGLLLALGERVDQPISAWEEMFLPLKLREHVREVMIPGPGGGPVPLVRSERTLYRSTAEPPPDSPPHWMGRYLLLGTLIGGLVVVLASYGRRNRAARFGFGALVGGWGMLAGSLGLVLAGLWGLTDHVMAYANENLFQVNPLALALCLLLPGALRGSSGAQRGAAGAALALLALSVIGALVNLLPGFGQANGEIIALALPIHAGVAAALVQLSAVSVLVEGLPSLRRTQETR
ncbi:MAG: DUF4105 domain-containing protein [Gemmatimonadales bacterium]